jgi:hypothetical protein
MRTVTVLGLGLLGLFTAVPAQALTISNTDADPRTVTVETGGESKELTIEPRASASPSCESACTIVLDNGERYEMEGGEEVAIEDGVIFVDAVSGAPKAE